MKARHLLCGMVLLAMGANAQTEVNTYQPGVTVEGVTYYLPQTAIRLIVTTQKTVYTPGEYRKYANRYLHLTNIGSETTTEWSIKNIEMTTYGTPDPNKIYSIKLEKRTIAPLVSLTTDGILLSINTEATETALPPVPQGSESSKHPNPRDFMNQEILAAKSNAKIAELVAEEIYDIRESKSALIKGEADNTPKDGEQLQIMLNQLNLQEQALAQLFKGTIDTCTEVFTIDITPTEFTDKTILFRFSKRLGVVDKDDLSGTPVYLSLKDMNVVPEPVLDEKTEKKKSKMEQGVYYNVPERVEISIFTPTETYCKGEYPMGQFGNVEILSNVLFDKKTTTKVTFHQDNGGIKQLTDEVAE